MAITTSRLGLVIDTLVTKLKASATFADPVRVYDGPQTGVDTMWQSAVFIGFDGDWRDNPRGFVTNSDYQAVLVNQQMAFLGNSSMFEQLEIQCAAEFWSGDVNVQNARNGAIAMLAGVESVIRTDFSLGIDGSTIASLHTGNLSYYFDNDGNVGSRIAFIVHVQTTLLTV